MTIKLVSALDNGGKTFDRYTLCFRDFSRSRRNGRAPFFFIYGASENPMHPQGFGQYGGVGYVPHTEENPLIGLPVAFDALPSKVREFVHLIETEAA